MRINYNKYDTSVLNEKETINENLYSKDTSKDNDNLNKNLIIEKNEKNTVKHKQNEIINNKPISFNKSKSEENLTKSTEKGINIPQINTNEVSKNYERKNIEERAIEKEKIEDINISKDENIDIKKESKITVKRSLMQFKNKKEDINKDTNLHIEKEEPLKANATTERTSTGGIFNKFFRGKNNVKRVNQQIITFMGGKSGVGNSQIAFNTSLNLANKGLKVMYLDLNDRFSSLDYILQLGYNDVGIDTALYGIKNEDFQLVHRSIVNINKILPVVNPNNYLYKTYSKIPSNIDFLFFSTKYMDREKDYEDIDYNYLKDLIMYLMIEEGYDFIILDANSDIYNRLTQISLTYSTKIFFTVTQDVSVLGNHLKTINIINKKRINFREKFYYLLNQYENADLSLNDVFEMIGESIKVDSFNIVPIPNLNRDLINANYNGIPLLWQVKSKTLTRAFSEIEKLIL